MDRNPDAGEDWDGHSHVAVWVSAGSLPGNSSPPRGVRQRDLRTAHSTFRRPMWAPARLLAFELIGETPPRAEFPPA